MSLAFPTFTAGMVLSMSLIMAIGPQNAHVLRMGLQRQHLWLTVAVCALSDVVLISLGVLGLAQLGGLSDKLHGAWWGPACCSSRCTAGRRSSGFCAPARCPAPRAIPPQAHRAGGRAGLAPPGGAVGPGVFLAQPARLARHGRADRFGFPGLWAAQRRVRPGRRGGLGGVVLRAGRGRVLARPPAQLAAGLARARRPGRAHDVGHGGLAAGVAVLRG
ncbi:lysine efflux permease [Hydrogenophaga taeniospiralis CCUG 15921]|uniref:Lysine efflux permease n=1 Tax=Hydrogenophaga taeniospiralis CCUG 15921 TaxID=1281780 RepID=A0A9X4SEQ4_9BURK|nr:lysine efflux permease [Hydrogenophaga taeniospiralis CCUG 15921]